MSDIEVRKVGVYNEVIVKNNSAILQWGLLDDAESIELAKELIEAAYSLMPTDREKETTLMSDLLECLAERGPICPTKTH